MSKCQTDHLREHQLNVCIESLQGLSIPWHKPQNSIKPGEPAQKTSVRYLTFPFLRLSGCLMKPLLSTAPPDPRAPSTPPCPVMYKSSLQGKAKSNSKHRDFNHRVRCECVRPGGVAFPFPTFCSPPPRRQRRADEASRSVLTWPGHRLSAAHRLFESETLESQHS